MFRGAIRKLSLRQKLVILTSVGVLLPIFVLTYLQYQSLTELENKTKGAFKDNLRQGLTIVERQMKQRLVEVATQTVTPVSTIDLSSAGAAAELEKHFANVKRAQPEIEKIFAFRYRGDKQATYCYVYFFATR